MPFNGAGVFQRVRNWVADATAGIKIRADFHDNEDDGFAEGLTNCITKDGQTIVTQNIPMNSKRITGLEDPVNDQDAVTKAYAFAKAGGTMTGDLLIRKDTPAIKLDDTATPATSASIYGAVANEARWLMRFGNGTPETGSNAGSDFDLHSFDDDGNLLGRVLYFDRTTGLGFVHDDPTLPRGIATKGYVDTAVSPRVLRTGDTLTGFLTTASSANIDNASHAGSIMVHSTGGNAAMSFHCGSTPFGANFGLSGDGHFYMGGWSYGANVYKFWTTRDFAALPTAVTDGQLDERLADLLARIEALEAKGDS